MTQSSSKYSEAGVDIDKGNLFVSRIKNIVAETHGPGVLSHIGGFSGLFSLSNEKLKDPVLVASTDGVGTKLAVAKLCNKHDTIGIDLVAMCVNDVVVSGAKPLFFLDYFACNALDLKVAADVVRGIATGCKQANCSLIGGETAEMPGLYQPGDYDLAGFVVGICDADAIIDGSNIRAGDKIIGLASSGFHSNGYSLVRKVFFEELGKNVDDYITPLGCTVGEELLRPTRIYADSMMSIVQHFAVKGVIHITGGGFIDNIPRILPKGCTARINAGSWPILPCFTYLQEMGGITPGEMYRTYNMGIGMMVIVSASDVENIQRQFRDHGEQPYLIGEIQSAETGSDQQIFIDGVY
ncbi:phosphoribosylformylglycinamidine cyclo-ligase [Desulfobulbus oligotrophicus]|jgi:phosphoribosylformylglycinamidine cyclo-ligase|uniref:Phosphoribosylformylglycinamidine cyclo-ligase n=1 Tax=Desulfobulbus oligotrophicus TaxID=1909699 RepID=A0A7T5VF62_9BACT|nr:phosphoribosylformylglycinamidine cyclo-ligase [Desulfobulbus oligotrophicus]MDY0391611.1 phosphoribosylformylglycinamidine cyclo-ligase [Desulfobulbus oligotrophicus]QQG66646.1 phosphoribosylformylglycinamidine cyclo-ligase [Desulfobulbus oligotrophicus]